MNNIATYYDSLLPELSQLDGNHRLSHVKTELGSIIKPGMSVLDLGCGTGYTSKFMAQLGAKVTAVDIAPKLIEWAEKNNSHKNAQYLVGDITEMKIEWAFAKWRPTTFDIITIIDAYEHLPRGRIIQLLKTIDIHSRENTIVYLNIPDERFQKAARKNIPEKLQIIDEAYSISNILDVFRSINFETIKINIYGIDTANQYNSFVFIRKNRLEGNYLWWK